MMLSDSIFYCTVWYIRVKRYSACSKPTVSNTCQPLITFNDRLQQISASTLACICRLFYNQMQYITAFQNKQKKKEITFPIVITTWTLTWMLFTSGKLVITVTPIWHESTLSTASQSHKDVGFYIYFYLCNLFACSCNLNSFAHSVVYLSSRRLL